jgi:hypothetical protein
VSVRRGLFCIASLALLMLCGVGCQSSGGMTADQFIRNNQDGIRNASSLAANVGMLATPKESRQKVARYAYDVAKGIEQAASAENFDLKVLDGVVDSLLKKLKEEDRAVVASIVSSVRNIVALRLTDAVLNDPKWHLLAVKTFTIAAAQGVSDATLIFAGGSPQPAEARGVQSGGGEERLGTVVVRTHRWE